MKLSKLFHWLYAILLLLPVFSIGGKMLYVTFNQNANNNYSSNIVEKAVKITDQTTAYLIDKNELTFINTSIVPIGATNGLLWYEATYDFNTDFNLGFIPDGLQYSNSRNINGTQYYKFHNPSNDTWDSSWRSKNANYKLTFTFTFKGLDGSSEAIYNVVDIIYNYEVVNSMDNVFYYALDQINEQPIFSWAQHSFLVEPIAYVSELFGLSNSSPLITLLSYWLNISIIWLCFDIIMYVPLMAHRWLDKGAIE